jgi:hypothetical protein
MFLIRKYKLNTSPLQTKFIGRDCFYISGSATITSLWEKKIFVPKVNQFVWAVFTGSITLKVYMWWVDTWDWYSIIKKLLNNISHFPVTSTIYKWILILVIFRKTHYVKIKMQQNTITMYFYVFYVFNCFIVIFFWRATLKDCTLFQFKISVKLNCNSRFHTPNYRKLLPFFLLRNNHLLLDVVFG